MKHLRFNALACSAVMAFVASSANAVTWNEQFYDNFVRANASSLGYGWTDPNSVASISSSGVASFSSTSGYVCRPTGEASGQQQIVIDIPSGQNTATGNTQYLAPIYVDNNDLYEVGFEFGYSKINGYAVKSGSATLMFNTAFSSSYNAAHAYRVTASVSGTASPYTVNVTVQDVTAGTTVATATYSDSSGKGPGGSAGQACISDAGGYAFTLSDFAAYNATSTATALLMSGPPGGAAGSASYNFVVGANGALSSSDTLTMSDGGAGGSFSPVSPAVPNGGVVNFTYTPPISSTTQTRTISVASNTGSLTAPTALSYSASGVTTATSYTFTGPSSGTVGSASSNFTVTPNGAAASNITVTPSDGSAGGAFAPSTITFSTGSSAAQTFTYTAASTGTKTISTTNNGSLTSSPTSLSYTANPGPVTLTVNSASVLFSEGNWKGDTGRGGSIYRQSWNNGAWFIWNWTASASPTASLLLGSTSSNTLSCFLNGVLTDNIAASGTVTLSPKASVSNTLRCYLRNSTQSARWGQAENGGNTVTVLGLQIDASSSAGTAPAARPWVLVIGDSITEGIQSNGGSDDFLDGYSFNLTKALDNLGYDTAISACGYSGYIVTGDSTSDVPAYYAVSGGVYSASSSRWNLVDSGVSLLDANGQISSYGGTGTTPAAILIEYGTNETLGAKSTSDLQTAVTGTIQHLRAAAPAAKIIIGIPFAEGGGFQPSIGWGSSAATYRTAILNGVAAANDNWTTVLDLGGDLSSVLYSGVSGNPYINGPTGSNVHPILAGHAVVTGPIDAIVSKALSQGAPFFRSGFKF